MSPRVPLREFDFTALPSEVANDGSRRHPLREWPPVAVEGIPEDVPDRAPEADGLGPLGEAALAYARQGLTVFPAHGVIDEHCGASPWARLTVDRLKLMGFSSETMVTIALGPPGAIRGRVRRGGW